ncbi:hypothetical protein E2C01_083395 [Portunus trituberculatus]|uniref:Uncharacterized protein n=1 Tax=Portunus trituberculatus TaxID=210409 RepID=A0A5B7IV20_PORTR|nr:hypothetical protein [Portunus trituberculatus]
MADPSPTRTLLAAEECGHEERVFVEMMSVVRLHKNTLFSANWLQ